MKKTLFLLIVFFAIALKTQAQFVLTPSGFVDSKDESKNYVICSFDNKTQSELYNKVLMYITANYLSPKDVISKVENSMISINGFSKDQLSNGKVLGAYVSVWDMTYTIVISFKDGKIKIDSPGFIASKSVDGKTNRLTLVDSNLGFGSEVTTNIFNKKSGKVVKELPKQQLERYFNGFVDDLSKYITKDTSNNW